MSHSCPANGRTDGGHGGLWKTIFIQKLKELGMSRIIPHGFSRALFDCNTDNTVLLCQTGWAVANSA